MKRILLLLVLAFPFCLMAQSVKTPLDKDFEPIKLYFVMLVDGTNLSQDTAAINKIQEAHLANIQRLSKEDKLLVAGPFADDNKWRGIFIFKCKDEKECEAILKTDPAVASGRLAYEIHPWMTGKNCVFK